VNARPGAAGNFQRMTTVVPSVFLVHGGSAPEPDQEHIVKNRWLPSVSSTLAGLALGLGLAAAVQAQSIEGEVKKVDVEAGKVTLKHGEIKNLDMPAMQMAFRVANPAWLTSLQVGDKVKFSADKVNGQFTVTALEKK